MHTPSPTLEALSITTWFIVERVFFAILQPYFVRAISKHILLQKHHLVWEISSISKSDNHAEKSMRMVLFTAPPLPTILSLHSLHQSLHGQSPVSPLPLCAMYNMYVYNTIFFPSRYVIQLKHRWTSIDHDKHHVCFNNASTTTY
jgi:hypothetical protein